MPATPAQIASTYAMKAFEKNNVQDAKLALIIEAITQITVILDEIRMLNPPIDYEEHFAALDKATSALMDLQDPKKYT